MTHAQPRVWYQSRPSADRLGNARHIHGPLQPMSSEDVFEPLFSRLLRKVGR